MSAKDLSERRVYYHIYNCGVEKRIIFNDAQDYETFEGFLKDYLTPPADPESTKKVFTVHGRSFKGTPHQPKNYFGKIELIAYGLMPNHFHLLIHQKIHGSLEGFIRSLCTRYSMYFNKKHHRTGSLFEGPYKSVQIKDTSKFSPLISFIHHGPNDYSSYPEYSGKRKTSWVNTKSIPFRETHEQNQTGNGLLDGITFENDTQYLERRSLTGNVDPDKIGVDHTEKTGSRIPEISVIFVIFLLLVGLGLRNINISMAPSVLSESVQPTNSPEPKTMMIVKITEGASNVSIRQGPAADSEKIGEANDGDSFEFVSVNSGWYEVKLTDIDSTGFISSKYTYLEETNN